MALAALWPDLAKFRHFGKILDIFGDFWGFGKKFNLLWHILNAIGQIFIVVQGQISKIHTAIWSHCLAAFVTVFESEQKSWLVHIIADTNLIEDGSACFYKIRLNRNNNIFWIVVEVKWSACLPSTPTIRVWIPLTPSVFYVKFVTTFMKMNKRGKPIKNKDWSILK